MSTAEKNPRATSTRIGDIIDFLNTARSMNEILFMAANSDSVTSAAADAIQTVCDEIEKRLTSVHDQLEAVMEDLK